MRIDLEHSDTAKPDADATERLYSGLTESQHRLYIPESHKELFFFFFLLWNDLLGVTGILSQILAVQHFANQVLPAHSDVDNLDHELRGHHVYLDRLKTSAIDPVLTLYMHHFELFFE